MKTIGTYGIMAEFASASDLVAAANHTREAGYKKIDAYSPFPVEGLAEAIGFHHDEVPLVVLIGALLGGLGGYLLQYWISVVSYPVNVGGKPYHSWPAFIIPTFEMTVLFGYPLWWHFCGVRHASAQRVADALPSGVQCAAICVCHQGQIFPDRVFLRSQVQA